jgi:hypothetical protein
MIRASRACRTIVVFAAVALATLSVACGTERAPTAPSSPLMPDSSTSSASNGFGQLTTTGVPDLGTCLREPSVACLSFAATRHPLRVGVSALSAPINLSNTVVGSSVTLVWTAPAGVVTSYVIEAGSSSGLANLANFSTGSSLTTFSTTGVPVGTYYVRVRAVDSSSTPGPASNEVVIVVIGGGCVLPGAPTGLTTTTNSGGTVTLGWIAAPGSPTSYVLEAGSAPGMANLASTDVGATTSFTATGVVAGTYFVRVRGRNACGIGAVSIEITVVVTLTVTPGGRSSMSARIDGVPWVAIPQAIQVLRVNLPSGTSLISIGGNDRFACPILLLTMAMPRAVGTYTLGPGSVANASLGSSNCSTAGWSTIFGGSGSITLTTLTSTTAAGTFSANLTPTSGSTATGTRVITEGAFSVTF